MINYEKLEFLGNGSNGNQVFKVRNVQTNEIYAMKIISMIGNCTDFLNEVNILKSLDHPNIVKYKDSFQNEDNIIVIMEYVDFGDLNKVIRSRKETNDYLDEEQIWKWFFELTSALEYIHNKKILHRDVKVHNAFINSLGHIKLGDFGISKILECSLDYTNSALGTPYYLSPEICSLDKYNLKTDIWMLGCLIYELSTFKRPFAGESIPAIVNSIKNKDPEEISSEYSKELRGIIGKMLIKDQNKRPSIKELINDDVVVKKYREIIIDGKKKIESMKNSLTRNNQTYFKTNNNNGIKSNLMSNARRKFNKSSSMNANSEDYVLKKQTQSSCNTNNSNSIKNLKHKSVTKYKSITKSKNNNNNTNNEKLISNNNEYNTNNAHISNSNKARKEKRIEIKEEKEVKHDNNSTNTNVNLHKRNNSDYIQNIINKNTNSKVKKNSENEQDYSTLLESNIEKKSHISNTAKKPPRAINTSMPEIQSKLIPERKLLKIQVEDNGEKEDEKYMDYKKNAISIYKKKLTKYNVRDIKLIYIY